MITANHPSSPTALTLGMHPFDGGQALQLSWDDMVEHRDYLVRFARRNSALTRASNSAREKGLVR